MNIIAKFIGMWLTRSMKPFEFLNEYNEKLTYEDCENPGLYVHIPFCREICGFCPYCKEVYDKGKCDSYIDSLIKEIRMVGSGHAEKKQVSSLYFGGGTPALAFDRIGEIVEEVEKHFVLTEGIGTELHPQDINVPILQALQEAGINKISIGIQSFQNKYQNLLGRNFSDTRTMERALSAVPFETVSIDLIFALPGQTFGDLKKDIDRAFHIGANHIAIYPFIDFAFTDSTLPEMTKKDKRKLLDDVTCSCAEKGYERNSIWTFSKDKHACYSSMTRDNFLGFGCSATTLLRDQFKINTFSVDAYCERIRKECLPTSLTMRFTLRRRMIYYLFWMLYSTKFDPAEFEKFFGKSLNKMYGFEFWLARRIGFLEKKKDKYHMTPKGAFYYHHYENHYTLAYIDKMWGIMKDQAFPDEIKL